MVTSQFPMVELIKLEKALFCSAFSFTLTLDE